jgi:hypothetical protein
MFIQLTNTIYALNVANVIASVTLIVYVLCCLHHFPIHTDCLHFIGSLQTQMGVFVWTLAHSVGRSSAHVYSRSIRK